MSNIAWLGLGAMGSRMVTRLLSAGHSVKVCNRSPQRAQALAAMGAQVAATPYDAALGSEFVFSIVRDDDASRSVWTDPHTGALAGMSAGAVAIESSTLTPAWVRELGAITQGRGITLLDAPVAGSRPQADAGKLIFLAGGDHAVLDRVKPLLLAMGESVHHAGPLGCGSSVKLLVNALFGIQVAAIAELLGLAQADGLDATRALDILNATPVASPAVKVAGAAMLAAQFAPAFPVDLVAKDFGYLLSHAQKAAARLPLSHAVADVLTQAQTRGLADENLTALFKLYAQAGKLPPTTAA